MVRINVDEEYRIQRLRERGDEVWNEHYDLLVEYIGLYYTYPTRRTRYKGFNIGDWCGHNIHAAQKPGYPPERREKLEKIGLFENCQSAKWDRRLKLFCEFVEKYNRHPNCDELYYGEDIGYWYRSVKKAIENNTLSDSRREAIEKLNLLHWF